MHFSRERFQFSELNAKTEHHDQQDEIKNFHPDPEAAMSSAHSTSAPASFAPAHIHTFFITFHHMYLLKFLSKIDSTIIPYSSVNKGNVIFYQAYK